MTFEVGGKQYVAILTGLGLPAKTALVNTPELREMRNQAMLFVFGLWKRTEFSHRCVVCPHPEYAHEGCGDAPDLPAARRLTVRSLSIGCNYN
jgi:hypothetical protein